MFDRWWLNLAARIERWAAKVQSKGYGAFSIRREVATAVRFLPATEAVVVDVGANRGEWSRELLVQARARISRLYIVEPSRAHAESLTALAATHPGARYVSVAFGAANGTAPLYFDHAGSGLASLTQRRLDHFQLNMNQSEPVTVETLDSWLSRAGLERIDMLKLDVEGHELDVLKGAAEALAAKRIGAIAFEFGGGNIDTRTFVQDFWYLLRGAGFELGLIGPFGLARLNAYDEALEAFRTSNFFAWRPPGSRA